MTFEHILAVLTISLYFLASLGNILGAISANRQVRKGAHVLTLAGFGVNTLLVITNLVVHSLAELSAGYYMLLLSWCIILLFLCAWSWLKTSFMTVCAAPLALILLLLSVKVSGLPIYLPENMSALFFGLHVSCLFISFGLLTLAAGTGLLFLLLMRKIKNKSPLSKLDPEQPALNAFDKINNAAVISGFPLYSIGLVSGYIWTSGIDFFTSPKILFALIIWCMYGVLFYLRLGRGIRGKKAALMAIAIFIVWGISIGIDLNVSLHHSYSLNPVQ